DRDARRERAGVVVDIDRFLPTGHHRHTVMAFARDRAFGAEGLKIRVGILHEPVVPEEIHRAEVGHCVLLRSDDLPSENEPLTIEYYISTATAPRQCRRRRAVTSYIAVSYWSLLTGLIASVDAACAG